VTRRMMRNHHIDLANERAASQQCHLGTTEHFAHVFACHPSFADDFSHCVVGV